MPVLYVNPNKQDSLEREPYTTFLKKFDIIKEELCGEQIELRVGGKAGSFVNGFYVDEAFFKNPRFKFNFAEIPNPDDLQKKSIFVRATYSYDCDYSFDLDFHLQRVLDIKKRAPYYYIPGASHFEFSSQIDDDCKLFFDFVVEDKDKVADVCCLVISLIIAILSLDN